ncbi:MAG: hypothetical protein EPO19_16110 [Betaproteobacteria bacterium]|nr:MAG: hypothetical protein EPO19_16110 [Betaproteobacteria bacterium]
MKARLIARIKEAYGRGTVEGVIWEVPAPAQPSARRVKYRLVYVSGGERVVGYDNERGKGDHKHIRGAQAAYAFRDVPTLIRDFLQDVQETES